MSKSEIKKQEEVVAEALSELERLSEVAEAKMNEWDIVRDKEKMAFDAWLVEAKMDEWDILRDKERKQFEAWRVEHRLLSKMMEEQDE